MVSEVTRDRNVRSAPSRCVRTVRWRTNAGTTRLCFRKPSEHGAECLRRIAPAHCLPVRFTSARTDLRQVKTTVDDRTLSRSLRMPLRHRAVLRQNPRWSVSVSTLDTTLDVAGEATVCSPFAQRGPSSVGRNQVLAGHLARPTLALRPDGLAYPGWVLNTLGGFPSRSTRGSRSPHGDRGHICPSATRAERAGCRPRGIQGLAGGRR